MIPFFKLPDEVEQIRELIFLMDFPNLEIEDIAIMIIAYLSNTSVEAIEQQNFSERLNSYVNACQIKSPRGWGKLESNLENEKDCYLEICKQWSDIHRSPKSIYRRLQDEIERGLEAIESNIRECKSFCPKQWSSSHQRMGLLIYSKKGWDFLKKEYIERNEAFRQEIESFKNSEEEIRLYISRQSRVELFTFFAALVPEKSYVYFLRGHQFRISRFSPMIYKFIRWEPDEGDSDSYISFISRMKKIFDADYRELNEPMDKYIRQYNVVDTFLNDLTGVLAPARELAIQTCLDLYSGHSRDLYSFIALSLVQIEGMLSDLCQLKGDFSEMKQRTDSIKGKMNFLYGPEESDSRIMSRQAYENLRFLLPGIRNYILHGELPQQDDLEFLSMWILLDLDYLLFKYRKLSQPEDSEI